MFRIVASILVLLLPLLAQAKLPEAADHVILLDGTSATKLIVTQDGKAPNKIEIANGNDHRILCEWVKLAMVKSYLNAGNKIPAEKMLIVMPVSFYLEKFGKRVDYELFCTADTALATVSPLIAEFRPDAYVLAPDGGHHAKTFTVIANKGQSIVVVIEYTSKT